MERDPLKKPRRPAQEKAKLFDMNNFHLNLPGGKNREYKGKTEVPGAVERTQIMDAIDKLLVGEFANLDIDRINKIIANGRGAISAARAEDPDGFLENKALHVVLRLKENRATRAEEELRPLFNRLVAMGFSPELLAR